jgi:WD40 repeat protein
MTNFLLIGFSNGLIQIYNLTPENNYTKFKIFTEYHEHKKEVLAVLPTSTKGYLLSISKENCIICMDITKEKNYKQDEHLFPQGVTSLYYDRATDRIFIGTK